MGGKVSVAKRHWEPPSSGPAPRFLRRGGAYSVILAVSEISTMAGGRGCRRAPAGDQVAGRDMR